MQLPDYRLEEWYQQILRHTGGLPFVAIGDFPSELRSKFARAGLPFQQIGSLDELNETHRGLAWTLCELTEDAASTTLAAAASLWQPARLYFEIANSERKGLRPTIERAFFAAGYRKTPEYHLLVAFSEECYWNLGYSFERVPAACLTEFCNEHGLNQREAGLHRDMLRDSDRRADAHTMRYHWAAQFLRPYDTVLDAACGLGYGSTILFHNSPCARVLGLDNSDYAIRYARSAYGSVTPQLEFTVRDVTDLSHLPDRSVHAIVSFETLEHLADPLPFLRECRRVLIPGGRFICSVPNNWADETGKDPNPYHFQVYTKKKLLEQLSEFFLIERVFSQKAGDGFRKFPENVRTLFEVDPHTPEEEAEWWLAVGMVDPISADKTAFQAHYYPQFDLPHVNISAFGRDYDNPWLLASVVTPGQRTENKSLLDELASRAAHGAAPHSADRGAALCVSGYRALEANDSSALNSLAPEIEAFLQNAPGNAHQLRWKISLEYLLGQIALRTGRRADAIQWFDACAHEDCLAFSPTLGTKTVESAFLLGWLKFLDGQRDEALAAWEHGMAEAERILSHANWDEVRGRRELPFDWGFVEVMAMLQHGQLCAHAIHSLRSGLYSEDRLPFEIFYSATRKNSINSAHIGYLSNVVDAQRQFAESQRRNIEDLHRRLCETDARAADDHQQLQKVIDDQNAYIKGLNEDLIRKTSALEKLRQRLSPTPAAR